AGIALTGVSLLLQVEVIDQPITTLVVQATAPFSVPLPSSTPVGNLTVQPGFSTLTVNTSETKQSAIFSSKSLATQYTLELLGGVTDLDGAPVRFDLAGGEVAVDLTSTSPQIFLVTSGRPSSVLLLTAGIGLSIPQPVDGPGTFSLAMS